MKVADKVVVVTGAGAGIGRELALELLRRKAKVAAVDVDAAGLKATAALAGAQADRLLTCTASVADRAAVEALPAAVQNRFGAVDGLINCAGIIQPFVRVQDLDYSVIDRVFGVNWLGTLYATKAFLPLLLKRPSAHVVNISSMGGFIPVPGQTAYCASKAAVKLFTEGLYAELKDSQVRVTIVFPGAVATDIAKNSGVSVRTPSDEARGKAYPASQAAQDILNGMERDQFRILVGQDAKMLDVLYRLYPQKAVILIANKMKDLLS